jgi:TetR/AcrR family transcriptional regulator, transcriptional repressor for nem operon
MTDSKTRAAGKRERLIGAAALLLHKQGVEATTLADIAKAADVALGNVYYYFKTKDDIVAAVIEEHVRELHQTLAAIESRCTAPGDRLKGLLQALATQGELVARYGCPHGTLCQELAKRDGDLSASAIMTIPVDWAEKQFAAMGRADARDLAIDMIAGYQGTALLTNTLRAPHLMERECARISAWIDSL